MTSDFYAELLQEGLRDLADPRTTRSDCELFATALIEGVDLDHYATVENLLQSAADLPLEAQCLLAFAWTVLRTDASLDSIRDSVARELAAGGLPMDLNAVASILEE
jgi:hypothetical protein